MADDDGGLPERVPNAQRAQVPREKIARYLLDESRRGTDSYKAGLFRHLLGFDDEGLLARRLRDHVISNRPTSRERQEAYGQDKYQVRGLLVGQNARVADVVTVWRVTDDEGVPILVTAMSARGKG